MNTTVENIQSVAERLGVDQPVARSTRLKRWLLWAVLGIAVVLIGLAIWMRSSSAKAPQYVTQRVERGTLTIIVSATGTLAPTNEVDVGSELSGIVRTVEVDYDDRVKAGQVLARLDRSRLEAQAMQAKATLEAAKARVRQTQATVKEAGAELARAEQLAEGQLIARSDLDAARAAFERAEADRSNAAAAVAQAEATLQATETDLAKTIIRSPINGVVLIRNIDPGQTVAASFQAPVLFTIAEDLTKMELNVDVDEADVGQVRPEQEATFTVDAYPERVFTAQVAEVRFASETVNGVVTYKTILYVDNADLLLRPGMTATADIVVRKVTDTILVPNAGLRFVPASETLQSSPSGSLVSRLLPRGRPRSGTGGQQVAGTQRSQRVWVLHEGAPVAAPIVVGDTDGVMTEVVEGDLQPGTPVIVDTVSEGEPS